MFLKKLFVLVSLSFVVSVLVAQPKLNDYKNAWRKIDSLVNKKGLTQNALTEINKIYALAKKEKNDAQIIKALLYRMNVQQAREENAIQKNILELEKEVTSATEASRSILLSLAAETYFTYLEQYRWQLYNRTETVNFKKEDIATWGISDFNEKISSLFLASLQNEKLLKQTRLEPFEPIIIKGNTRHLRPTLFDLLAHRALAYFKNDERNITKPAYAFEITDPMAFVEAPVFARHNFVSRDSLSLHFMALQLYQRIIEFHLKDEKPDALIDADIDRLEFVYAQSVISNKEELYRRSLEYIATKYSNNPGTAQAWFLLAQLHTNKAAQYDAARDTMYRFEYLAAKAICEKVLATPVLSAINSEGKANIQNLLNQILQKELNFQSEKVNIPGEPFRILISYRNFTQLHFRVIKIDKGTKGKLGTNTWEEEYWKKLLQLTPNSQFSQTLPDAKDHQRHAVEIKANPLPVGEYALLASVNSDFTTSKNYLAVQFFHVSNISYINNGMDYFALHRETGQPLSGTTVQVWHRFYDHNTRIYTDRKGATHITDNNGYVKLQEKEANTRNNENIFRLEFTHNKDHLFLDDYTYHYFPGERNPVEESRTSFLFTDRSIYRPGQIVYFKGIVVNRSNKETNSSIVPNLRTKLVLYDVNHQKLDSISVTTNEYGSYSGRFTLPTNLLNGEFMISDEITGDDISFHVEEYKRPKFFVEIKKPEGTYKVNDTITVTGNAKAYAGNYLNEAQVKYRVTRNIMIPFWKYGYGRQIWPPHLREEMEIANGMVTTHANGQFFIQFKAIPDNSLEKKDQPVFYYEVDVDVTDLNGETRSSTTTISVAYQALQLRIEVPEKIHADSLRNLKIKTTNLNDIFEKANVTLRIFSLKSPDRIFRQRYWQRPDQFVMTREEYYKFFPHDIYSDEDDASKWSRIEKVFEKTDTTSINSQFALSDRRSFDNLQLKAGWYVIEGITKDKFGEEVKDIKYVQVYTNTIVSPAAFGNIESNKIKPEPGEKVSYRLNTNLENVFIIHDVERDEQKQRNFFNVNKNTEELNLTINENDRGGIHLNIAFVKHNRVYTDHVMVDIPFTNKQLNISFETYRDKTLPGSDEKWKVKISGYNTDQVAAELLTTMYDASLDQFQPHDWQVPSLWKNNTSTGNWQGQNNFSAVHSQEKDSEIDVYATYEKRYDQIAFTNFAREVGDSRDVLLRKVANAQAAPTALQGKLAGVEVEAKESLAMDQAADTAGPPPTPPANQPSGSSNQIRKNFNETAFFFPDLKTDAAGNIEFSFTIPEALTQWKWMLLAHTKDLALGMEEKSIMTQKELMVQPNPPRFLREGDRMDFSGKIVNLSAKELTGQVELQLIDPSTNQAVDGWFHNMFPNQYFTAAAGQSVPVSFTIEIPFQYNRPVVYRLIASSGLLKDGEEMMVPVVSNQLLVTESIQLPIRGKDSRQFKFENLLKSGSSETLSHHALTVEFTTNPAWYAVQALPYLMEYPYECSEQNFNKFYANALASKIANSSPRIREIFERWKSDTTALLSNLQKNQELKSILLQETPWVLQAKTEAQQKKNIAILFDMVRMSNELESTLTKLQEMQTPNGGFPWFKNGPDDRYITQYILTGIGHLQKLNAIPEKSKARVNAIIKQALMYLDKRLQEDYNQLVKLKTNLTSNNLGSIQIQFLYMRSFFSNYGVGGETLKAYSYYRKQSQQFWLKQSKYMQGMIALSLNRTGDLQTARDITASIKQNALISEELGMYWKDISWGYYWYQAPVETQSLLIETFTEITKDEKAIADMKTWLLKHKQTQNWRTTKATADACYALLLQGNDWLTNTPEVSIVLGDQTISSKEQPTEAGSGYFKKTIEGKSVKPSMGEVQVTVSNATNNMAPAWGAVYWQYFENLDKITTAATPLQLTKKLFIERNSDRGPVLHPVNEGELLKVGDKIKVRIELRSDRNMEYLHMKDMRGACMEPVNVISQYKWQGGLGYYETTKDASTSFFFNWLPKGTYVFEYAMFVTHAGTFSNGVTTIQCMYAPEFTSHSEGVKVNVE